MLGMFGPRTCDGLYGTYCRYPFASYHCCESCGGLGLEDCDIRLSRGVVPSTSAAELDEGDIGEMTAFSSAGSSDWWPDHTGLLISWLDVEVAAKLPKDLGRIFFSIGGDE